MSDYIKREDAIAGIMSEPTDCHYPYWYAKKINGIPAAPVHEIMKSAWVPVSEKLPEPFVDVLTLCGNGHMIVNLVDNDGRFLYSELSGCVTHWMPLPEPPKEEADGQK